MKSRRFRSRLEYDGTAYHGWQIQNHTATVQGTLEAVLGEFLKEKVRISAAGRTDAGVHALGQVISFTTKRDLPARAILKGGNAALPADIRLTDVEECPSEFNPRKDARLRWYRYLVLNRGERPVWSRHFLSHVPYVLDDRRLFAAAEIFPGVHDFAGFRSLSCTAERTRLNMRMLRIQRCGEMICMDIQCRSFLQNMVRILAGGILEHARGKIPLDMLRECLESGNRDHRIPTAPATGLTLMRVYYEGELVHGASDAERTPPGQPPPALEI